MCLKCKSPVDVGVVKIEGKKKSLKEPVRKFSCFICDETFARSYKLKLHLMSKHKNKTPAQSAKAKELFARNTVYKCGACKSKPVADFSNHLRARHCMTKEGE